MEFIALEKNIYRVASQNYPFGMWYGFAGDSAVETNQGLHTVYLHAGTNPFEVINQAVK